MSDGVHVPAAAQHFLEVVLGIAIPEGSVPGLYAMADDWDDLADALGDLIDAVEVGGAGVDAALVGMVGRATGQWLERQAPEGLRALVSGARESSKLTRNAGADVVKTIFLMSAMALFALLTIAELLSTVIGALLVPAVELGALAAVRAVVAAMVARIRGLTFSAAARGLRQVGVQAGKFAVLGAGLMGGLDLGFQVGQIAFGAREGLDGRSVLGSVVGGALGGAFAGVVHAGGLFVRDTALRLSEKSPGYVRAVAHALYGGAQVATVVVTAPAVNAATGSPQAASYLGALGALGAMGRGGRHGGGTGVSSSLDGLLEKAAHLRPPSITVPDVTDKDEPGGHSDAGSKGDKLFSPDGEGTSSDPPPPYSSRSPELESGVLDAPASDVRTFGVVFGSAEPSGLDSPDAGAAAAGERAPGETPIDRHTGAAVVTLAAVDGASSPETSRDAAAGGRLAAAPVRGARGPESPAFAGGGRAETAAPDRPHVPAAADGPPRTETAPRLRTGSEVPLSGQAAATDRLVSTGRGTASGYHESRDATSSSRGSAPAGRDEPVPAPVARGDRARPATAAAGPSGDGGDDTGTARLPGRPVDPGSSAVTKAPEGSSARAEEAGVDRLWSDEDESDAESVPADAGPAAPVRAGAGPGFSLVELAARWVTDAENRRNLVNLIADPGSARQVNLAWHQSTAAAQRTYAEVTEIGGLRRFHREVPAPWGRSLATGRMPADFVLLEARGNRFVVPRPGQEAQLMTPRLLAGVLARTSPAGPRGPLVVLTRDTDPATNDRLTATLLEELVALTGPVPTFGYQGAFGVRRDGTFWLPAGADVFRGPELELEDVRYHSRESVFGFPGETEPDDLARVAASAAAEVGVADPVVFVSTAGGPGHTRAGVVNGTNDVEGHDAVRLLFEDRNFRDAVTDPARPIVVASDFAGSGTGYGDFGFDFARALRQKHIFNDVYAPTGPAAGGGFRLVSGLHAGDVQVARIADSSDVEFIYFVRFPGDAAILESVRRWARTSEAQQMTTMAGAMSVNGTRVRPVVVISLQTGGSHLVTRSDGEARFLPPAGLGQVIRHDEHLRRMLDHPMSGLHRRDRAPVLLITPGGEATGIEEFAASFARGGYARDVYTPAGGVKNLGDHGGFEAVDGWLKPVLATAPGPERVRRFEFAMPGLGGYGRIFPSRAFDLAGGVASLLRDRPLNRRLYFSETKERDAAGQERSKWTPYLVPSGPLTDVDRVHGSTEGGFDFSLRTEDPALAGDRVRLTGAAADAVLLDRAHLPRLADRPEHRMLEACWAAYTDAVHAQSPLQLMHLRALAAGSPLADLVGPTREVGREPEHGFVRVLRGGHVVRADETGTEPIPLGDLAANAIPPARVTSGPGGTGSRLDEVRLAARRAARADSWRRRHDVQRVSAQIFVGGNDEFGAYHHAQEAYRQAYLEEGRRLDRFGLPAPGEPVIETRRASGGQDDAARIAFSVPFAELGGTALAEDDLAAYPQAFAGLLPDRPVDLAARYRALPDPFDRLAEAGADDLEAMLLWGEPAAASLDELPDTVVTDTDGQVSLINLTTDADSARSVRNLWEQRVTARSRQLLAVRQRGGGFQETVAPWADWLAEGRARPITLALETEGGRFRLPAATGSVPAETLAARVAATLWAADPAVHRPLVVFHTAHDGKRDDKLVGAFLKHLEDITGPRPEFSRWGTLAPRELDGVLQVDDETFVKAPLLSLRQTRHHGDGVAFGFPSDDPAGDAARARVLAAVSGAGGRNPVVLFAASGGRTHVRVGVRGGSVDLGADEAVPLLLEHPGLPAALADPGRRVVVVSDFAGSVVGYREFGFEVGRQLRQRGHFNDVVALVGPVNGEPSDAVFRSVSGLHAGDVRVTTIRDEDGGGVLHLVRSPDDDALLDELTRWARTPGAQHFTGFTSAVTPGKEAPLPALVVVKRTAAGTLAVRSDHESVTLSDHELGQALRHSAELREVLGTSGFGHQDDPEFVPPAVLVHSVGGVAVSVREFQESFARGGYQRTVYAPRGPARLVDDERGLVVPGGFDEAAPAALRESRLFGFPLASSRFGTFGRAYPSLAFDSSAMAVPALADRAIRLRIYLTRESSPGQPDGTWAPYLVPAPSPTSLIVAHGSPTGVGVALGTEDPMTSGDRLTIAGPALDSILPERNPALPAASTFLHACRLGAAEPVSQVRMMQARTERPEGLPGHFVAPTSVLGRLWDYGGVMRLDDGGHIARGDDLGGEPVPLRDLAANHIPVARVRSAAGPGDHLAEVARAARQAARADSWRLLNGAPRASAEIIAHGSDAAEPVAVEDAYRTEYLAEAARLSRYGLPSPGEPAIKVTTADVAPEAGISARIDVTLPHRELGGAAIDSGDTEQMFTAFAKLAPAEERPAAPEDLTAGGPLGRDVDISSATALFLAPGSPSTTPETGSTPRAATRRKRNPTANDADLEAAVRRAVEEEDKKTVTEIIAAVRSRNVGADDARIRDIVHQVRGTTPRLVPRTTVDDVSVEAAVVRVLGLGMTKIGDIVAAVRAEGVSNEGRIRDVVHRVRGTKPGKWGTDDATLEAAVRRVIAPNMKTYDITSAVRALGVSADDARIQAMIHRVQGTEPSRRTTASVNDAVAYPAASSSEERAKPDDQALDDEVRRVISERKTTSRKVIAEALRQKGIKFSSTRLMESKHRVQGTQPRPRHTVSDAELEEIVRGLMPLGTERVQDVADAVRQAGVTTGAFRIDAAIHRVWPARARTQLSSGEAWASTEFEQVPEHVLRGVVEQLVRNGVRAVPEIAGALQAGRVYATPEMITSVLASIEAEAPEPGGDRHGDDATEAGQRHSESEDVAPAGSAGLTMAYRPPPAREPVAGEKRSAEDAVGRSKRRLTTSTDAGFAGVRAETSTGPAGLGTDQAADTSRLPEGATPEDVDRWVLARLDTGASPADVAAASGGRVPAHRAAALYNTAPDSGAESRGEALPDGTFWEDQGRRRTNWPAPADEDLPELYISHAIRHGLRPIEGMDDLFHWRDPADPLYRVAPAFAGPDGDLHPEVRRRAGEITAKIVFGKSELKGIAEDPADPRLPEAAARHLDKLWPKLERRIADEIRRVVRTSVNPTPDSVREAPLRPVDDRQHVYVGRVKKNHVAAHEPGLVHQLGLFLAHVPGSVPGKNQPTLANGHFIGIYAGAHFGKLYVTAKQKGPRRRIEEEWGERHPAYPAYHMAAGRERDPDLMSSEGAANSTAFANSATDPETGEGDDARINTVFLGVEVSLPDRNNPGRTVKVGATVFVALDNAFDPEANPYGLILAAYGEQYEFPEPQVKAEPEE
ncbi:hypothetical protein [Amycolatopsis sp. WQ 127309]|uniref:hypothetical protein n=1 Tax=Amycolatopsis sp. WQ 127309 TaxID=2932773 RepID=UPI001FF6360A|nr:hypothetical protein [Amycolatopsis sp. WQ 127309]UOZ06987.1 hypothetical protein MUY22_01445 [Amycolatopsis sp. WQ 127309]